jgi:alkylation response protein AidB-like acyl-CoA dehydrogenase
MSTTTESSAGEQPDLVLSPEQSLLSDNLRRLLASRWDIHTLLADSPPSSGDRKELWRQLDADTALAGINVPTRSSGSGAGVRELCIVAEAMGHAMCAAPWIGTLGLAVPLLSTGDHPAHHGLLERIATEGLVLTVAWSHTDVVIDHFDSERVTLSGKVSHVLDGAEADCVVVAHQSRQLYSVDIRQPGVSSRPCATLDAARSVADFHLDRAIGISLGPAEPHLSNALDIARLATAAELLGVAARSLEIAVEYAKQRVQFGRLIGSYQAVKHRCARMLIDVEQSRSLVRFAAWVADTDPGLLGVAAREALWFTAAASLRATTDLIRSLGGIGFTWEHEAHLYYRRARSAAVQFGDQLSLLQSLGHRTLAP